jgi:hypothetical protein
VIRDFQIASARLQQCRTAGALPQPPTQATATNPAQQAPNPAQPASTPATSPAKPAPPAAKAAQPAPSPASQPQSELASLADRISQAAPRVNDRNLRSDPDFTQNVVDLIFGFEHQSQSACGPLTPEDDALLRVAGLHTQ